LTLLAENAGLLEHGINARNSMETLRDRLGDLMQMQRELASAVRMEDTFRKPPQLIAGIDIAFLGDEAVTACVVASYPSMTEFEVQFFSSRLDFPYIPTFLAFREGPAIREVMGRLSAQVDVFLLNAQGIAHPRRCGCASQVGVETGKPTIGVTQNRLCGKSDREPLVEGDAVALTADGEQVGWILMSHVASKPIYVSPGHLVSLSSSLDLAKGCLRGHRLPEPLQMAHALANRKRTRLRSERSGPVFR